MSESQSLDDRWVEFGAATHAAFAHYPQLEPLRFTIFKQLLVGRAAAGADDCLKQWLRPLRQRASTSGPGGGPLPRAEVLLCPETRREVFNDALLPVYRELKARGVNARLLSLGAPSLPAEDTIFFQFPARMRAPRWAGAAWDELVQAVPALHGHGLRAAFVQATAQATALLDEMTRVLEAVQPRVLVTASANLTGGASGVLAGRRAGAATILLQHGIPQAFYVPLLAEQTLCWGQTSVDTLRRLQADGTLSPLGSPRHDALAPTGQGRQELLRALDLPDKPTLVFFSNGNDLVRNGHAPEECARWLNKAATRLSGCMNFVVRLHPNETGALYEGASHLRVTKDQPGLAATLDGCDVAASLCSTVLYDALLFRKPVWQFYADGWPALADNWREGLAARVASVDELSGMAEAALHGRPAGRPKERTIDHVFANHGRAAQAVAEAIVQRLAA